VAVNRNEIDRLKAWVEQLDNRPPIITTNAPSAPQDTAKVHVLAVKIDELEREIQRTRSLIHEEEMKKEHDHIWAGINDYIKENELEKKKARELLQSVSDAVGLKAGLERVDELEKKFVGMLAGVGGMDQFATRDDLKRAYSTLF
jgi:hypothetical protein